ncbi:prevent host death protein, Phd antitoxin |uniref:Antitoxin n=1 Tax=Sulfuriferula multivorans TaxID=1559896 RepID=A0A401JDX6_9PROT|nr:type II toxin-antitoxin system prevent-host-death family antitoxin [Sulfuriferula multivorans]GBL45865.1 prevent host death protein, Phd antitoxin \
MAIKTVNIHEAKTQLSALLASVQAGDEVIIAKANKPVARLVLIEAKPKQRTFGLHKDNMIYISDDFDAPLEDAFWLGNGPL